MVLDAIFVAAVSAAVTVLLTAVIHDTYCLAKPESVETCVLRHN